MDKIQDNGTGISVQGLKINNLRFAYDNDLIEESCETLQDSVRLLNDARNRAGLKINIGKTKTMVFGREEMANEIKIEDQKDENVKEFVCLGSLLTRDNDCTKEIKRKIAKVKGVMAGFNNLWKSKQIIHKNKLNILKTCVFSTALYTCEA